MSKPKLDVGIKSSQANFECSKNENFQDYDSYKYTPKSGGEKPLELAEILYTEKELTLVIGGPIKDIKEVITYFKGGNVTLLLIHIITTARHHYLTNPGTSADDRRTAFDEFVTKGEPLEATKLRTVLAIVDANKRLDYDALPSSIKSLLWRANAVVLELSKTPEMEYITDITAIEVSVTSDRKIGKYKKVQYSPKTLPFSVQDIKFKDGQRMQVRGGFPNDLFQECYVYYGDDQNYDNPLLVDLNIETGYRSDLYNLSGRYLLSKNGRKAVWDIRRIDGSLQDKDDGLGKVLANIEGDRELTNGLSEPLKNKLIDVTRDLTIDLTMAKAKTGKYTSEKREIPYTRYTGTPYHHVRHASLFPSFTVGKIKTPSGEISGSILPPKDHLLVELNAYYKGSKAEDVPLLVGLKDYYTGAYKYYMPSSSTKDKWEGPTDITDSTILDKLQESLKLFETGDKRQRYSTRPETVDSKTELNIGQQGGTYFGVGVHVWADEKLPEFYTCMHMNDNNRGKPFIVKSVNCGNRVQYGFPKGTDQYLDATVYFLDQSYRGFVLIELICEYNRENGSPKTAYYYSKDEGSKWKGYILNTHVVIKEGKEDLSETRMVIDHVKDNKDRINLKTLDVKLRDKLKEIRLETKEALNKHPPVGAKTSDSQGCSTKVEEQPSTNIATIVGGVVGGIVGVAILGIAIWKLTPVARTYFVERHSPL